MSPADRAAAAEAAREQRARPSNKIFALILVELCFFAALAVRFDKNYVSTLGLVIGGFSLHYWLPFRYKEYFWFAFSIVGTAYFTGEIAGPRVAAIAVGLTVATGLLIYGIFATPLPYWTRALGVVGVFAGFILWGAFGRKIVRPPAGFFAVFGFAFAFRIFPYLYEARHFKKTPSLKDFVRYFFMMPGFKLSTVDYQKLGQSYYQRDINVVAQQGVRWIARGAIQYAAWIVAHDKVHWITSARAHPLSPLGVAEHLILGYTLYLSVSCRIHFFVGIMHLFGYDLPEPYRWFALAHSPLDFWRRANVYWKDIMLKTVFMPVYFALRKKGDLLAKIVAISIVFAVTWFLHIWNDTWKGQLGEPFWKEMLNSGGAQGLLFWGSYGALCVGNTILESRAENAAKSAPKKRLLPKTTPPKNLAEAAWRYLGERIGAPAGMHPARAAIQILAMQIVVATLFSLRHAPSTRAWYYTIAFWR